MALLVTPSARTPLTAGHLIAVTGVTLATGIAVAIVTTPDPLWWQLYFSRLGMFHGFSGTVFNLTLVATGLLLIAAARYLHHSLHAHLPRIRAHRSAPAILTIMNVSMGAHLSGVGFVPLTVDKDLHDQAASGIVLSFAAVLIATPILLKGLRSELTAISAPTALMVAGGIAAMSSGAITLAVFEVIAFTLMFAWLLMFSRLLVHDGGVHVGGAWVAQRLVHEGVIFMPRPAASLPAELVRAG